MTKSKPSLRNSAKYGLLLNILVITCLFSGCSSSAAPTYLKKNITQAIQDICKKEYKFEVRAKSTGRTLWVYMPTEKMFAAVSPKDKPQKYTERFSVDQNKAAFENEDMKLAYDIKAIPEQEKTSEYTYDKDFMSRLNNIMVIIRRVLFSTERKKSAEPDFICIVAADIKNGFEMREISYYQDLKKVSYGLMGVEEYQHRTIQELNVEPKAVGDREGSYLDYKDIKLADFIADQIEHRIKLKFSKPEVKKDADIDKEIMKAAILTIKAYDFKDFSEADFENLLTNKTTILNRQAIWAKPIEKKF